ncbi:MAG: hypothetical protein EB075_12700, partial [Bacteroidetes bacterium]|nr:hypothetical protein [Bacteroidota bacterium]
DGSAQPDGAWGYGSDGQFGADVKWGIRQNLTLNATANPDFSQVEADVGQVVLNERFALFFPEKRPFFLDGLELFDTPGQMIYTRRIVDPIVGAKVGGKVGKTNIGAIVAADAKSMSQSSDEYPLFGVVRLRRDLPGNSTIGAVLTSREEGASYSRLAGVDLRLIHHQKYFVELQGVQSVTPEASGSYVSIERAEIGASTIPLRLSQMILRQQLGLSIGRDIWRGGFLIALRDTATLTIYCKRIKRFLGLVTFGTMARSQTTRLRAAFSSRHRLPFRGDGDLVVALVLPFTATFRPIMPRMR